MNGVTVLYEYTEISGLAVALIVLGVIFAMYAVITLLISRRSEWVLGVILFCVGVALWTFGALEQPNRYVKALISPSVPYVELIEHYEVEEITGSIYTLKIKGGSESCTSSLSAESADINSTFPPKEISTSDSSPALPRQSARVAAKKDMKTGS